MSLVTRLDLDLPVVQAGMGGGIAGHRLAAAVSEAGGLGTIGYLGARASAALAAELDSARQLTSRPLAVNILLPFCGRRDFEVAARADAVVTFWGRPRRRCDGIWIHHCGSVQEAREAQMAGADGAILQGVEAGGHVRGVTPAAQLLEEARAQLPEGFPLWLGGGIADADDVGRALAAGAEAAVLGTRFLLSEEAAAHPLYKERLLESRETVLTELFGLGWPAPHRVVPNEATRRWLRRGARGPLAIRAVNRVVAPIATRLPPAARRRALATQRPGLPLFSPAPPTTDAPAALVEAAPLYAGETVARIKEVRPAGELVRDLAPR
jgi:nitronate monooxygenase